MQKSKRTDNQIRLTPVDKDNWRDVARIKVTPAQRAFVMEPSYYLALCSYDGLWQPLAICSGEDVIGFMMWARDPQDRSCWLGGIMIDAARQGQGCGKQAVRSALEMLSQTHGCRDFALSYQAANTAARSLYAKLGFVETGEMEDNEIVAMVTLRDKG